MARTSYSYRITTECKECGGHDVIVRSLVPITGPLMECSFTGAHCAECDLFTCSVHGFRCGHAVTCPVIPGGRHYQL